MALIAVVTKGHQQMGNSHASLGMLASTMDRVWQER
jgi:hypothetical protein